MLEEWGKENIKEWKWLSSRKEYFGAILFINTIIKFFFQVFI